MVRLYITKHIKRRTSRLPYHADSTAGMTSAPKTAASETDLSLSALSVNELQINGQWQIAKVLPLWIRTLTIASWELIDLNRSETAHAGGSQILSDTSDDSDDGGGVRLEWKRQSKSYSFHTGWHVVNVSLVTKAMKHMETLYHKLQGATAVFHSGCLGPAQRQRNNAADEGPTPSSKLDPATWYSLVERPPLIELSDVGVFAVSTPTSPVHRRGVVLNNEEIWASIIPHCQGIHQLRDLNPVGFECRKRNGKRQGAGFLRVG